MLKCTAEIKTIYRRNENSYWDHVERNRVQFVMEFTPLSLQRDISLCCGLSVL